MVPGNANTVANIVLIHEAGVWTHTSTWSARLQALHTSTIKLLCARKIMGGAVSALKSTCSCDSNPACFVVCAKPKFSPGMFSKSSCNHKISISKCQDEITGRIALNLMTLQLACLLTGQGITKHCSWLELPALPQHQPETKNWLSRRIYMPVFYSPGTDVQHRELLRWTSGSLCGKYVPIRELKVKCLHIF